MFVFFSNNLGQPIKLKCKKCLLWPNIFVNKGFSIDFKLLIWIVIPASGIDLHELVGILSQEFIL